MEIRSLLRTMAGKWWLIVPTFLMVVGSATVWTVSQPRLYEADSRLFVEPSGVGDTLDPYSLLLRQSELSETYAQIATSPPIRRGAYELLGLNAQQQDDVRLDSHLIPGTTLLSLATRSSDPGLARDYTNAIATGLVEFIADLDTPFSVVPLYEAGTPSTPVSPNVPLNMTIAVALGLGLSLGLGLVAELLSTRRPASARLELLDEETSAYSGPYFRVRLRQEVSRAKRTGGGVAIALVNANHRGTLDGHTPRTRIDALRQLAGLIDVHLRPEDLSARIDDAVFAIMLPDTTEADAIGMVDGLRARMAMPALGVGENGEPIRVQPAAGVVAYGGESLTDDDLMERARRALQDAERVPIGKTQSFSQLSQSGA